MGGFVCSLFVSLDFLGFVFGVFEIKRDYKFKSEYHHTSGHLLLYIDTNNLLNLNDLACTGGES